MKKLSVASAAVCVLLCQTLSIAAETPSEGRTTAPVRVKASGLGTDEWLGGKMVQSRGCTMVKLDRPSPNRYTSVLLVGLSHLQVYKAGQWADVAIPPMLKSEPASCKVAGSD
jgi:hypothetical protein